MTTMQRDDAKYIRNYGAWNAWPMCPLKRRNNSLADKNLGVLLCTEEFDKALKGNGKIKVFHVYLFQPPENKEEWDAAPRTEYSSIEELLADGWMVD